MDYIGVLQQLHYLIQPLAYCEIGVADGESLAVSRTRSIGIDPALAVSTDALSNKPWIKLYQMESDDFFNHHSPKQVLEDADLELSFIDGLHLFEQVLRDFVNLERWSSPAGVIAIHDVLPPEVCWAYRERYREVWVGDVWRIVPCPAKISA